MFAVYKFLLLLQPMPTAPRQGRKGGKVSSSPAIAAGIHTPLIVSPATLPPGLSKITAHPPGCSDGGTEFVLSLNALLDSKRASSNANSVNRTVESEAAGTAAATVHPAHMDATTTVNVYPTRRSSSISNNNNNNNNTNDKDVKNEGCDIASDVIQITNSNVSSKEVSHQSKEDSDSDKNKVYHTQDNHNGDTGSSVNDLNTNVSISAGA